MATKAFEDMKASTHGLAPCSSLLSTTPAIASPPDVDNLLGFICSGPLIEKLGFSSEKISESIEDWLKTGLLLCQLFGFNELNLSGPEKVRIYHFYIPVFLWCEEMLSKHRAKYGEGEDIPPLVIGLSAAQGAGKSTLVYCLDYLFQRSGRSAATLSIDDLYLTREDQVKLRDQNPGNRLLEFRGNAGSHDLQLSVDTFTALRNLTEKGKKMKLPRYNKLAYEGKGDRADQSKWPEVEGPIEVVLFEGWMLGFKPLPTEVVKAVDPELEAVNKNLELYYDAWDKHIGAWIIIKVKDPKWVFTWRLESDVAMTAEAKPGSNEQVVDFKSRFQPAYKAYLPTLYSEGPKDLDPDSLLVIEIDEQRNPITAS